MIKLLGEGKLKNIDDVQKELTNLVKQLNEKEDDKSSLFELTVTDINSIQHTLKFNKYGALIMVTSNA